MNKIILSLLLLTTKIFANECFITSYDQIIKINKVQDSSIIKESNCNDNIKSEFIHLVQNSNGKIHANFIAQYLKSEIKTNVIIAPTIMNISHIKDHIYDSIGRNRLVIKTVNALISKSAFTINKTDSLDIKCTQCNEPGTKDLSVQIGNKKHWLTANIFIKKDVYILDKSISNLNQRLSKSHFKKHTIVDQGEKRYFQDIENVQFYQFNKFLQKGNVVRVNDLVPKSIIKYGDKVKLSIKNKSINLSSIGIAKENGRFGDYIQVINPKSNKKITAKVINYKQAEIEL